MSLAFLKSVESVTVDAVKLLPQYAQSAFGNYRINLVSQRPRHDQCQLTYATQQCVIRVEIACADATVFAGMLSSRNRPGADYCHSYFVLPTLFLSHLAHYSWAALRDPFLLAIPLS